jgi:hypothetical protein
MRQRVEALDGGLKAGPRPGGGFEVAAWLPAPEPAGVPEGRVPEVGP